MKKIAIVDWFGFNLSPQERMKHIKEAGFSGVLLLWTDQFDSNFKLFPGYAKKEGLFVESAHASYLDADSLWDNTLDGETYEKKIIESVEECSVYGIPTLVMHPVWERKSLPENDIGIQKLLRIVDKAENYDVSIAIENTTSHEFLEYIFSKIQSGRLGFCYDSGHHNLYCPKIDLLGLYGKKLLALHLHDNDGKTDQHALPFTGEIDWNSLSIKLNEIDFKGAVSLEVRRGIGFEKVTDPADFLNIAIDSAARI